MTGILFVEYLCWLDNKIGTTPGRQVLLLLDNISRHDLGVELVGGKDGLAHVSIEFLLANTTSHWQPLDQGIIANWKTLYKREWLKYMIFKLETGLNPQKTVTLLYAIRWGVEAWREVKSTTIQACFQKSTVLEKPLLVATDLESDLQITRDEVQAQLQEVPGLREEAIAVDDFISLAEEEIEDNESNVLQVITSRYVEIEEEASVEEEEEEVVGETVTLFATL